MATKKAKSKPKNNNQENMNYYVQEKQTRTYVLANPEARDVFDLRRYESFIKATVKEFEPDADVLVMEKSYTVYGITKGAAIRIGRKLSKFFDEELFLIRKCLFISSVGETYKKFNLDS